MIKRTIDIIASAFAILLLSPLLIPVIVALAFTGEHEIFYSQKRIGRYGKPFRIVKFATMLRNSPSLEGGDITTAHDSRILPLGRILRRSKINELPQLINVLRGDMSLIGYRPLTPRVAELFPVVYWKQLASYRPGLSGIGSIVFRDEEEILSNAADREMVYRTLIVPYKSALELWYVQRQSVLLDFQLLFLTVVVVVWPETDVTHYFEDLPVPHLTQP